MNTSRKCQLCDGTGVVVWVDGVPTGAHSGDDGIAECPACGGSGVEPQDDTGLMHSGSH